MTAELNTALQRLNMALIMASNIINDFNIKMKLKYEPKSKYIHNSRFNYKRI